MRRFVKAPLLVCIAMAVPLTVLAQGGGSDLADSGQADFLLVEILLNGYPLPDFEDALTTRDSLLLLPVEPLVRAAEGMYSSPDTGIYRIALGDRELVADINGTGLQVQMNDKTQTWPESRFRLQGGQLFLEAGLLHDLFGLDWEFEPSVQRVTLRSERPLPADLRRLREVRWRRFSRPSVEADVSYFPVVDPYVAWGAPRGDLRSSLTTKRDTDSLAASLSGAFEVEAAYLSNRLFFTANDDEGLRSLRWTGGRSSPDGNVFGLEDLHRLEFGDVSPFRLPLQGSQGPGRGVTFSTAPVERPDLFDVTVIEGDGLPGWDVELYRGSELIDFQTIGEDGRYRFDDVPLGFGGNRFHVMLYGPQGQVQERTFQRSVAGGQLLPGELHLRGSLVNTGREMFPIGDSQRDTGKQLNLRADFGLSPFLTAGLFMGAQRQPWSRLQDLQRLVESDIEAGESLDLLTTGVNLRPVFDTAVSEFNLLSQGNGEAAFQGSLRVPVAGLDLSARFDQYSDGFISTERSRSINQKFDNRLALRTGHGLYSFGSLTWEYDRYGLSRGGIRHELSPTLRHRLAGLSLSHELALIREPDREQRQYRLLASHRNGALTSRFQLQGGSDSLSGFAFQSVSTNANYQLSGPTNMGANISYSMQTGDYNLGGRYNSRLAAGLFSIRGSVSRSGDWLAGLTYTLSLGDNGRRAFAPLPYGSATGGAVALQIFEDLDGGGSFSKSTDRPVSGAGVLVNGRPTEHQTDESGWLLLSSLDNDRPVRISVDRDSLKDPFLTAERPRIVLQPRPGYTHKLAMPLLDGAFVSGRVVNGRRSVAGLPITAFRSDGFAQESTISLSDGYFSFEALSPGLWEITVEQEALPAHLKASRASIRIEEGNAYEGVRIETGPMQAVEVDSTHDE